MADLNKVMLIGNVGNDPEMRFTPNGNPVTSFNLAVNHGFTTKEGDRKQETEWFTIVSWNRLAETCNQFLSRGRRAYVEGRLKTHTWESQDGQRRFRNEIIANQVLFLDRQPAAQLTEESTGPQGEVEPEDLPF
ncbi:MAG: single-stranded DNA-binding protein [Dehalococcoidia bacterium]|jgi:single-strand DNA-binding protein|nr:single-stranded DNA-binding protein [Dehalococcoidia bacterium]MDP7470523.1 single-stranded DNA-binding protein [Dehalococcoidia bacterium]